MQNITISVKVPVSFFRENDYVIAHSPVLDLSTSGKTFEEAEQRFQEVVEIFIEELIELGTLEEVLSDLGWKKVRKQWAPPALIAQELKYIEVPAR